MKKSKITARELLHPDLTAVMETDLIQDALHVLYSHRLSGVPVIRSDWILTGYLSESDILKSTVPTYLEILAQSSFLAEDENLLFDRFGRMRSDTVSMYMNSKPIFVEPTTGIMTVADLMLRKKTKRLPVVENNKLVGVIDRGAFCEFLMEGGGYEDKVVE